MDATRYCKMDEWIIRMDLHNLYYPLKKFRSWSEPSFGEDEDLDLLKENALKVY